MKKSEVRAVTGVSNEQLRDAHKKWGVIATPDRHWVSGQFSPISEYAADTPERLRIVQEVSPLWDTENHLLDFQAGREELVIRGYGLPPSVYRAVAVGWLRAELKLLIGRRQSSLIYPVDARSPNWEQDERTSISRAQAYRTSALPESIQAFLKAFSFTQAGVARFDDLPGGQVDDVTDQSLESLIHTWQSVSDEAILSLFTEMQVALPTIVGALDRAFSQFIELPPSMRPDDMASAILACVGHECKYHHSLVQAMLPAMVLHLPPMVRAANDHPMAMERQVKREIAAAQAIRSDIGLLAAIYGQEASATN